MNRLVFVILLCFIFISCEKNELGPQCINCEEDTFDGNTTSTDVMIINEGTWNWNNASISLYNKNTNQVSGNIFWQQNNQSLLGDVAQSMCQFNGQGYIVLNNSSKIEVVDIANFNSVATITGFTSPRYFLPVNNNKAYVTDLYSNSIQVVDLNNNIIINNISLSGWSEELTLHNDTVYVCDMTNDNLLLINPSNDILMDSIKLGKQPNSIVLDKNNKLWIMCGGGFNQTNPKLIQFNPQTRSIENIFVFPNVAESPGNLKINASGDELYFINADVYAMNINDVNLPSTPIVTSNGNIFYGLGIDPSNNDIYVADAIDYVQNGIVFRYSSTGSLIDQFNAGIIPNGFHFIQ